MKISSSLASRGGVSVVSRRLHRRFRAHVASFARQGKEGVMRTRGVELARCAAVLAALVLPGSREAAAQETGVRPPGVSAAAVERGEEIFEGKGTCYSCHGSRGEGALGPSLADENWLHGRGRYQDILKTVRDGVPHAESRSGIAMPARGSADLSEVEVREVAAYVWTLSRTKPVFARRAAAATPSDAAGSSADTTNRPRAAPSGCCRQGGDSLGARGRMGAGGAGSARGRHAACSSARESHDSGSHARGSHAPGPRPGCPAAARGARGPTAPADSAGTHQHGDTVTPRR
jgi:mono/diheme cytochrome c family protein